ncbi:hypothetical protein CRG98_011153 [Punica granatum]|uniref:Uncharacterized protein n=1 Tax=Punica granatum TaxID=22663 RepID=A0A2I0KIX3_PUNGR|nr:hypothetical protein CRG98_011153 [Punica granatum]
MARCAMTGESCQPSRAGHLRPSLFLHGKPLFTALGFGPTIGVRPYFWTPALHRALAPHLLHRAPAAFTALGFGPTSGSGTAFIASGSGPAFITLGFGLALGSGPHIELRPCIYCIGFRPRIYCIGFRPYIGIRPCIYYIGLRPYIYYIGLRPRIYCFRALTLHLLLSGSDPASGSGPAFTAFGLQPFIYCFWAPAQHLLHSGFDTSHLLLSGSSEIQNRLRFKFIQAIL